ncbi:MAG: hypothetical protein NVSMB42_13910 [Herpetosiphon sp.]
MWHMDRLQLSRVSILEHATQQERTADHERGLPKMLAIKSETSYVHEAPPKFISVACR